MLVTTFQCGCVSPPLSLFIPMALPFPVFRMPGMRQSHASASWSHSRWTWQRKTGAKSDAQRR